MMMTTFPLNTHTHVHTHLFSDKRFIIVIGGFNKMTEKFTCIFQGKSRCHQYPLLKSYKWMLPSAIPLMG